MIGLLWSPFGLFFWRGGELRFFVSELSLLAGELSLFLLELSLFLFELPLATLLSRSEWKKAFVRECLP